MLSRVPYATLLIILYVALCILQEGMQPTSDFLPGESRGPGSLVGHSPWVAELDMTEQLSTAHIVYMLLTPS